MKKKKELALQDTKIESKIKRAIRFIMNSIVIYFSID